jgi:UDP-N-acetylmuramoyl-tripeptide--D-alanyl-D-alanine ligase
VAQAAWHGHAWDVHATTPVGELRYALHIAGQHNVVNSLAAATCALAAGVPLAVIANGLAGFAPVKGRSRALVVPVQGRAVTVVDDTYNANPDSMRAAIEVLATLPAPRLLVVGDMGEVGDQGPAFHREAGEHARVAGIDTLLTLGEQSRQVAAGFGDAAAHCSDIDTLNARVLALLPVAGSVLVKGSRFMKMERVVAALEAAGTSKPHTTQQEGSTMAVANKSSAGGAAC